MDVRNVARTLGALAEPNRFRIVELLRDGPRSVGGIVEALDMGQPQVSRHLRILGQAGLVEAHRQAQQRIYRLCPPPFEELAEWSSSLSGVWADRLDRLDALVQAPKDDPIDERRP